jgi:hypothetical protein
VLFKEACLVWVAAVIILWLRRDEALTLARQLPIVGRFFNGSPMAAR